MPGYLLLITFGNQGVIGRWLKEHFNLEFAFNWKGAVLASAVIAFPLMVQAAKLSVRMIDRRIELAASTLGASPFKVWRTVTLPLMAPGILIGSIMVFSRSLGEFGATITFVGNIAGETRTLPLAIYSATHQINGDDAAMRLIIICIGLAFFLLLLSNLLTQRVERWLGVTVLKLDFTFQRGNYSLSANCEINSPITGILGASGSGKSTLLSAIVGLIKPQQGLISLNDRVLFQAKPAIWLPPTRRIGLVFQDGQLLPHYSVKVIYSTVITIAHPMHEGLI